MSVARYMRKTLVIVRFVKINDVKRVVVKVPMFDGVTLCQILVRITEKILKLTLLVGAIVFPGKNVVARFHSVNTIREPLTRRYRILVL